MFFSEDVDTTSQEDYSDSITPTPTTNNLLETPSSYLPQQDVGKFMLQVSFISFALVKAAKQSYRQRIVKSTWMDRCIP